MTFRDRLWQQDKLPLLLLLLLTNRLDQNRRNKKQNRKQNHRFLPIVPNQKKRLCVLVCCARGYKASLLAVGIPGWSYRSVFPPLRFGKTRQRQHIWWSLARCYQPAFPQDKQSILCFCSALGALALRNTHTLFLQMLQDLSGLHSGFGYLVTLKVGGVQSPKWFLKKKNRYW